MAFQKRAFLPVVVYHECSEKSYADIDTEEELQVTAIKYLFEEGTKN
jgi:hypothetical protein